MCIMLTNVCLVDLCKTNKNLEDEDRENLHATRGK